MCLLLNTSLTMFNKGYIVKIGRGRKDGGIDVIAKKDENILLIQCKRWKKRKIFGWGK